MDLQWRYTGCDSVPSHQPHDCLLNRLFRRRSKETAKLRVTGLCAGNSPVTSEFPGQMARNAENVSVWWRNHVMASPLTLDIFTGDRWTDLQQIFSIGRIWLREHLGTLWDVSDHHLDRFFEVGGSEAFGGMTTWGETTWHRDIMFSASQARHGWGLHFWVFFLSVFHHVKCGEFSFC